MSQASDIFDPHYAGSKTTEVNKPQMPQLKEFLIEPISDSEMKIYGISKPTRIVTRGKISK